MQYLSTRGKAPPVDFRAVVLGGLAPDGGLYIPERIPDISAEWSTWAHRRYTEYAFEILRRYADLDDAVWRRIIEQAYTSFDHKDITPVVRVGDLWILELFHGPTLAFKDLALQLLGRLFDVFLGERGERLNILVATSGDTGSAAIHGVRGSRNVRIFVMHPRGRISPLQVRQMTSVLDPNVFNLAIDGTFDDCQRILKTLLADADLRRRIPLGAMNSVNWARIAAQIVYYFYAAEQVRRQVGASQVRFAVPTGNFGDIFAGYMASRMGLPVAQLLLATNENDILFRCFESGEYRVGRVVPTLSPSMDIQVASNFERYLFYRLGEDPARVRDVMSVFERTGSAILNEARGDPLWAAARADTEQTCAVIRALWEQDGYLVDPHTAVAISAAWQRPMAEVPTICLATAHPAKFPDAIHRAVGADIARHERLEALLASPTRVEHLPAEADRVRQYLLAHAFAH